MAYDFTTEGAPKGSNSVKWDMIPEESGAAKTGTGSGELLPMWVAEMDFPAAPFIVEALHRRIDKGVFGYTFIPDSYYDRVIDWFSRRHGWNISRGEIIPISGIVPATSVAIRALSMSGPLKPGAGISAVADASGRRPKIIMQTPAYNCFFSNIRNMGCELSENRLVWDGESRRYRIDWEDFERRCADPDVKAFLLCNPHNPCGRLWSRKELTRLGEICLAHGIPVISDEIQCEIVNPVHPEGYTPFASISEEFARNSISFVSPTKSFNIAGLQIANIISANEEFRARIDRVINDWEHCDVNQLGIVALEAAYSRQGEDWLAQMNEVVAGNFELLKEALGREFPDVRLPELEATYLALPDFSALFPNTENAGDMVAEHLLKEEKLRFSPGSIYGAPSCCRINLACPRTTMKEAVKRLLHGLHKIS